MQIQLITIIRFPLIYLVYFFIKFNIKIFYFIYFFNEVVNLFSYNGANNNIIGLRIYFFIKQYIYLSLLLLFLYFKLTKVTNIINLLG